MTLYGIHGNLVEGILKLFYSIPRNDFKLAYNLEI